MALTTADLLDFWQKYFIVENEKTKVSHDKIMPAIQSYMEKFGFSQIPLFSFYLLSLCRSHLEGYSLSELKSEADGFKYVGGPILYST